MSVTFIQLLICLSSIMTIKDEIHEPLNFTSCYLHRIYVLSLISIVLY